MASSTDSWRTISIKVDLIQAAPVYVNFLQQVLSQKNLLREPVIKRSLYRYENYWLPLLAEWQQTDLEPPQDVLWIWHLHILKPNLYNEYCKERFGRVLPHNIRLEEAETQYAIDRTRLIWKDNFRDEPYELDIEADASKVQQNGTKLAVLLEFALEQQYFFHQVSLPHYVDGSFLFKAFGRYKQLLLFKKTKPNAKICLPYDIQLIWRTHMLHPIDYKQEISRMLGNGNNLHDLGDINIRPEHILNAGEFNAVWKEVVATDLFAPGTGPRGPANTGLMVVLPKELYASAIIEDAEITLNDLVVADVWSSDTKIVTEARKLRETAHSYDVIFRQKGVPTQRVSSKDPTGLGTFTFDAKCNRGIEFHVFGVKKRCCTKQEKHVSAIFFNPRQAFKDMSFASQTLKIDIPKISYTDVEVSFLMKVKAGAPKSNVFTLERDNFYGAGLPTDLRPFVTMLPQWKHAILMIEDYRQAEFLLARHTIKNKRADSQLAFGCQVVKQDDLDLGAVLLYQNNQSLVAVGYSIGAEQLATQEQLSSACPVHFEEEADDHAMLIKNATGDWAVVVARWIQENKSTAEGKVSFHVYNLQADSSVRHFDVRDDELHNMDLGNGIIVVDMPTGRVTVDSKSNSLPEDVTLAFCVGILFVTCQKKPMSLQPAIVNGSVRSSRSFGTEVTLDLDPARNASRWAKRSAKNRKLTKKRKMSASFTFLLASGLQIDAALYGSVGPSLASSRASSVSNLIKSSSDASLPQGPPSLPVTPIRNNQNNETTKVTVSPISEVPYSKSPVNAGSPASQVTAKSASPVKENGKRTTQEATMTLEPEEDEPKKYMDVRL